MNGWGKALIGPATTVLVAGAAALLASFTTVQTMRADVERHDQVLADARLDERRATIDANRDAVARQRELTQRVLEELAAIKANQAIIMRRLDLNGGR